MNEIDEKILTDGIRIPLVIKTIKTDTGGGGHEAKILFPESALAQVKQLMGTENKIVYMAVLVQLDEIQERPRQKPGPKPKEAE